MKRNTPEKGPLWRRQRRRALVRDRHTCVLCGAPATQVDHIVPRSRGGGDDLVNLRSVCGACHRVKSEQERLDGLRRSAEMRRR